MSIIGDLWEEDYDKLQKEFNDFKSKYINKLKNLTVLRVDSYCSCSCSDNGCCGGSIETNDTGTVNKPGRGDYVRLEDIDALIKELEK